MNNIIFFTQRLKEIGDQALKDVLYLNMSVEDVLEAYRVSGLTPPIMIKENNMN